MDSALVTDGQADLFSTRCGKFCKHTTYSLYTRGQFEITASIRRRRGTLFASFLLYHTNYWIRYRFADSGIPISHRNYRGGNDCQARTGIFAETSNEWGCSRPRFSDSASFA